VVATDTVEGFAPCSRTGPCVWRTPPGRVCARERTTAAVAGLVSPEHPAPPLREITPHRCSHPGAEPITVTREFRMICRTFAQVPAATLRRRSGRSATSPRGDQDSLLDGSLENRWANLENFWKPRDAHPRPHPTK